MTHLALVTAAAARGLDEDLPPLAAALKQRSIKYSVVDWDDPAVDWSAFDLALIRSTWDYTNRVQEFLGWAQRVSRTTKLVNPAPVIAWNTDKHYLRDLAERGCAVVPTSFVEIQDDGPKSLRRFLRERDEAEFVVKPAIGAGSRDTQRYRRAEVIRAEAHIGQLTAAGRSVVLQPYLTSVDRDGETALIYFRGSFSHAIRKGPLLQLDATATRALFAPEHISARAPSVDEFACAQDTLRALPVPELLYARIDLIRDAGGVPQILEVELTEPSLFFAYSPASSGRFIDAMLEHLSDSGGASKPEL